MTNVDLRREELSRLGQEALQRLINKVEGCNVIVPDVVSEGAGRSVAIIATCLDPAVVPASIRLLADIVKMTYKAGYLHGRSDGRSDVIRESN